MGLSRTEEFKDCVLSVAKQKMDEARLEKLKSSLILPTLSNRSPFIGAAIETTKNINMLHKFIVTHQKDYTDRVRSTEQDRDKIEHEVGMFVKTCQERIDFLKNLIGKDESPGHQKWLNGLVGSSANADLVAHQHGVVLMLSENLHSTTALFDRFRAIRFQEAIEKVMPRWRKGLGVKQSQKINHVPEISDQENKPIEELRQNMLDDETNALQMELTNLLDAAQATEQKMIEMSALNHLFSTHVLHQAQQIEMLYQQAVAATDNVEKGNAEIRKTIDRSKSSRTFTILFLVVLPLALLFLHWYS